MPAFAGISSKRYKDLLFLNSSGAGETNLTNKLLHVLGKEMTDQASALQTEGILILKDKIYTQ